MDWSDRHWVWLIRFVDYGAVPGGVVFVLAGSLLLLPDRTRRG